MMNYGLSFLTRREYITAISYLERAEKLDPTYGPVEANLGVALGGLERNDEAEQHFKRALELAPSLAEPHIFYGRWLFEKDRLAESQAQLEAAVQANPLSLPARDLLMKVYAKEGDSQAFTKLLADTVKVTFNEEVANRYMTELAERKKRTQAARYPDGLKPEELVNLSATYCKNGNYMDCIGAAQKALDLRPGYAEAYNNMAAAYLQMKRWDEGIQAAQLALQSKPGYAAAKSNLEWGLAQKTKEK
jgi:Tfp pilus assembly protein PilF